MIGAESRSTLPLSIEQRISVNVLKKNQTAELKEPRVPSPDVYIMLPSLANLRDISERIQKLASRVVLSANFKGKFRLRCTSPTAEIDIEYHDLINPKPADAVDEEVASELVRKNNPESWYNLTIDARDFVRILHW